MNRIALCLPVLLLLCACEPKDESRAPTPAAPIVQAAQNTAPAKSGEEVVIKDYNEKLVPNPFDPDAVYLLSQKNGTEKALVVLIKRDSQEGTQYSRWQFNCIDHVAQNLGVASSIQGLDKTVNSMPSAPQNYEVKSRLGAVAAAACPH